jgi:hypothetical protein
LYIIYHTTAAKDRLTILDVLRNGQPRAFRWDDAVLTYVDAMRIADKRRTQLEHLPRDQIVDEAAVMGLLNQHLPNVGMQMRKRLLEALAVSAHHAWHEVLVLRPS